MNLRLATVALTALILTGCIRSHSVRHMPEDHTSADEQNRLAGPAPAATIEVARSNTRTYMLAYLEQAQARVRGQQWGSDVSAFGGIAGSVGGLTKSPETSILGLLLGAGGTYGEQRYQMRVQANNFTKAAASMRCLGNTLTPDPRLDVIPNDSNLDRAIAALANKHSDVIVLRLLAAQRAVEPAVVDTAAVKNAIKQELEGLQAIPEAVEARKGRAEDAETQALRDALLKMLDGKMGQCSAG
jgi:hypothetical protein